MNFFKKVVQQNDVLTNRTAAKIATRIIGLQTAFAGWLNQRIGNYSIKKQYAIILTIISLITAWLIISFMVDPWKMSLSQKKMPIPSLIGAASKRPVPEDSSIKKNSLTHQK